MDQPTSPRLREHRQLPFEQAASGQKEMLMSIEGKKEKEVPAKKPASKPHRKSA